MKPEQFRAIAAVFQTINKMIHDKDSIQKMKDAGKSEEWIAGAHQMFHVIETMMHPVMKAEDTDTQVQTEADISPEVLSMLNRFKGPMQ